MPEMLDHRVVTLHPKIHGGILADRSRESHRSDLETHGIEPFDLVVVNLYPFVEQPGSRDDRHRRPGVDPGGRQEPRKRRRRDERFAVRRRARRAARARHAYRRDEAPPRDSSLRAYRCLRRGDSPLAAGWRAAPTANRAGSRPGARARLRRESPPARCLLRRAGRRCPPPDGCPAAGRPHALVQQPERPRGRAPSRRRARRPRLRHRQARESVRRCRRRHDRGRVCEGARLGSGLGLRGDRRPQPAGRAAARRASRRAVRRGAPRACVLGRGARAAP